jgi:hypothetical protein
MKGAGKPTRRHYPGPYASQLTDEQLADGEHRGAVGGLWDELGRWQFELLLRAGLKPSHRLLDVG